MFDISLMLSQSFLTFATAKNIKRVFTIIADDGAEETLSARELGLDPDKDYTKDEIIKAACHKKRWSRSQISDVI